MVPFACDMTALSTMQRARHQELGNLLRSVLREVRELSDGYEFEFSLNSPTYSALTELTPLEHACCPFFSISIRIEPDKQLLWRLSGAEGVKQFIQAEFAQWFHKNE
jgi:hypothetical protein